MPLSATVTEGLNSYGIGPRVRELRQQKKMGLVELGEHTGLSAALLSKIERGKMYPTLPTLLRIAMVFSVGLDHFFGPDTRTVSVVRRRDRVRLPEKAGKGPVAFHFESLDFAATERKLSAYLAEFRSVPLDDMRLHRHEGVEFIHVLDGRLGLYIRDEETVLDTGDSVYFDATRRHGYRRIGKKACRALVVVVPAESGATGASSRSA